MFTAAKDAVASRGAQAYLNKLIAPYGKLTAFRIDSRRQTVEGVCLLHGESVPITVTVGKYVIEEVGAKSYIYATHCTCSRPWAQSLLRDFVEGRRLDLPGWAAAVL